MEKLIGWGELEGVEHVPGEPWHPYPSLRPVHVAGSIILHPDPLTLLEL